MTETTTQAPETVTPRKYYWILTIQWADDWGHLRSQTADGSAAPQPGVTRGEVFTQVFGKMKEQLGADTAAVLFFSLEPDDL